MNCPRKTAELALLCEGIERGRARIAAQELFLEFQDRPISQESTYLSWINMTRLLQEYSFIQKEDFIEKNGIHGQFERNTNTPFIIMKDGKPFMGLSTPGEDQQTQALVQVFLNIVEWGMSPQQALDQPRFGSYNFPATGKEINFHSAQISLEDRIPKETAEELRKRGHDVRSWGCVIFGPVLRQ